MHGVGCGDGPSMLQVSGMVNLAALHGELEFLMCLRRELAERVIAGEIIPRPAR
jgi:hypothetical protein